MREGLSPEARAEFDAWAKNQRETNIASMADSAMVLSVYPKSGAFDVEYALQVGASVLLDKPVLVLTAPGVELPPKLRLLADDILEISLDDVDTASPQLAAKIHEFVEKHAGGPS